MSERLSADEFILAHTHLTAPPLTPEISLHLAAEALPLWRETEIWFERENCPPPYWGFAWPGGQALARLLLDHPHWARGARVVDFGAGCGISVIAAAMAGARVAGAAEIDPLALAACRLNGAANGVEVSLIEQDLLRMPADCDLLLLGDMCYERPLAEQLSAWARQAARSGVVVLLADPGRAYRPADGLAEVGRWTVATSRDLEDQDSRETVVWRMLS